MLLERQSRHPAQPVRSKARSAGSKPSNDKCMAGQATRHCVDASSWVPENEAYPTQIAHAAPNVRKNPRLSRYTQDRSLAPGAWITGRRRPHPTCFALLVTQRSVEKPLRRGRDLLLRAQRTDALGLSQFEAHRLSVSSTDAPPIIISRIMSPTDSELTQIPTVLLDVIRAKCWQPQLSFLVVADHHC